MRQSTVRFFASKNSALYNFKSSALLLPRFQAFLNRHNLIVEDLFSWKQLGIFGGEFDQGHADALIYLVDAKGLPLKLALNELSGLQGEQAKWLIPLYDHNLRGEDFRVATPKLAISPWPHDLFSFERGAALFSLLTDSREPLKPRPAISMVNQLTSPEARGLALLYSSGLRASNLKQRKPVLETWTGGYIRQYNYKEHWTPNFVRTCDEYRTPFRPRIVNEFQDEHADALKHLICDNQVSIPRAMEEIRGIDHRQARALAVLYQDGLRGKHLREWRKKSQCSYDDDRQQERSTHVFDFRDEHINALEYLMRVKKIEAEYAITKIYGKRHDDLAEVPYLAEMRRDMLHKARPENQSVFENPSVLCAGLFGPEQKSSDKKTALVKFVDATGVVPK